MRISPKTVGFGIFIVLGLLTGVVSQFPDRNLHIVFCDVGQGDAVYIKTPQNHDILIDGGRGNKVLGCLSDHMPFYDRAIDIIALTHPQADHYEGLIGVLQRYSVGYFVISPVGNDTKGFEKLESLIKENQIPIKNIYTGDMIRLGDVDLHTLWPNREWLVSEIGSQLLDVSSQISSNVLGVASDLKDLNDVSLYFHIQMGEFDTLLTGDGDIRIQDDLMKIVTLPDVEVLKVPHHGSRTGMTEQFLKALDPELSVISVGKNSYGHPAKSILDMLLEHGSRVLRTDQQGDIEVVSDGKRWWIVD